MEIDQEIEVKKVNVLADLVHMVVVILPRVSVFSIIKYMKSQSGKRFKEKFSFMKKAIYRSGRKWSECYCVSRVGFN